VATRWVETSSSCEQGQEILLAGRQQLVLPAMTLARAYHPNSPPLNFGARPPPKCATTQMGHHPNGPPLNFDARPPKLQKRSARRI
jgi:hypothetical protein